MKDLDTTPWTGGDCETDPSAGDAHAGGPLAGASHSGPSLAGASLAGDALADGPPAGDRFFALLDDASGSRSRLYRQHVASHFLEPAQLDTLDGLLRQGWQRGLHALLQIDYGFGLALAEVPPARRHQNPAGLLALHWFATSGPVDAGAWLEQHARNQPAGISTPECQVSEAAFGQSIQQIHEAIRRGDCYQVNYTIRLHLTAYGHPHDLYRRLRQPVPYGALARLPAQDGTGRWTLCFSPELFLRIGPDGLVGTEPMKGTAPILHDGRDEQRAQMLRHDPKNLAENLMIVDLLRNDLGRIAQTGSVGVPERFQVTRFGHVWQMTSRVTARLRPGTPVAQLLRATFPCGSITGAPKRRCMEIIEALETGPRGPYTGSIGFLEPAEGGLGYQGIFNVAIRTLTLKRGEKTGCYQGVFGVGSGIVIDSEASAEYAECGWKARFLTSLRPAFGVFETMRIEDRHCALLARHLTRLQQAARALNLPMPATAQTQLLQCIAGLPAGLIRLKMMLGPDGLLGFSHAAMTELEGPQSVVMAPTALPRHDPLRRFKTTRRAVFDAGWQQAAQQGAFDSLFFSEEGVLLEGGRSSVFVRHGREWLTPALSLDILDGVMRQRVLADPQRYLGSSQLREARITRQMLAEADEVRVGNALRGVFGVEPFGMERGGR